MHEQKSRKLLNLILAPNRVERIRILLEIRYNQLILRDKPPSYAITYKQYLSQIDDLSLHKMLADRGEADRVVSMVRSNFAKISENSRHNLPFPYHYNADRSLSSICYAFTRYLKPKIVLETGVAYGMTTAIVLVAMERNNCGKLISIDLPPLSDPLGAYIGLGVPRHLRDKWIFRLGSSRKLLPRIVKNTENIGLFISDSANIYTLQKFEFESVWKVLSTGGIMVFNNISRKLQRFLQSVKDLKFYSVWQTEKPLCVTGILLKK